MTPFCKLIYRMTLLVSFAYFLVNFYARKQLLLSAHLSHRNSVCLSVCHTGGSVKSGSS